MTMALSFTRADYAIGDNPVSLDIADLNGDGTLDIATANNKHDGTVSILLGNGDGSFGSQAVYSVGSFPTSVAVGPLNGDGIPDLAVADSNDGTVSVLLGSGNGTFGSPTTFATAQSQPLSVAVGYLNGDGNLDLVTGSATADPSVSVLLGNGDGTFQPATAVSVPAGSNSIALGDLNGDAKSDLVTISGSATSVLLGNGNGTFQTAQTVGFGGYSVAIADLNGDSTPDLATVNGNSAGVLLGNSDGTFQPETFYGVGSGGAFRVAVGDLNGDGRPDLAVNFANSADSGVKVLLGNGDGTFQSPVTFSLDLPEALAIADLNQDGKLDIATVNAIDTVSVLLNTTPASNSRPVAADDSYTTNEDTALTVAAPAILANDSDADGDALIAALVSGPAHGIVQFNTNGSFSYRPAANYNGPDSFTYKANDGQADSNVATVAINVAAVNDAPRPLPIVSQVVTAEDVPAGGQFTAMDIENDPFTFSAAPEFAPQHGSVTVEANGTWTYTPNTDFSGTDTFGYRVTDDKDASGTGTVEIFVRPINDAPVAVDDQYSVPEDGTLGVSLVVDPPGVVEQWFLDFAAPSDLKLTPVLGRDAVAVSGP
jgi:VCBS repeat-containing protein